MKLNLFHGLLGVASAAAVAYVWGKRQRRGGYLQGAGAALYAASASTRAQPALKPVRDELERAGGTVSVNLSPGSLDLEVFPSVRNPGTEV